MLKRVYFLFLSVIIVFTGFAQQTHVNIEIPAHQANETLISHEGYTLSYNVIYYLSFINIYRL
jgi:hypothetical protein